MRKIIFSTHFFLHPQLTFAQKKIESNLLFLSVRGIIAQPITADITIKKTVGLPQRQPNRLCS